jgi:Leu/Phe-tRNA-protein transferase
MPVVAKEPAAHLQAMAPQTEASTEQGVLDKCNSCMVDTTRMDSRHQGEMWSPLCAETLKQLVIHQIPRFQSRPYLSDAAMLGEALSSGLATQLVGDFCWSLNFSPAFIRALCYEGFLPICCEIGGGGPQTLYVLLPKLHEERCVLEFEHAHFSRKTRKRAKRYTLTVGLAFERVLAGCRAAHPECWLYPPLSEAFTELAFTQDELMGAVSYAEVATGAAPADGAGGGASAHRPRKATTSALGATDGVLAARMLSFELWLDDDLVAGEFGSVCGCSYTSFSGFYHVDGAGAVQMALTAQLLQAAGFTWWDMGQEHAYKLGHGAELVHRHTFLERYRAQRERPNALAELVGRHNGRFAADQLQQAALAVSRAVGLESPLVPADARAA